MLIGRVVGTVWATRRAPALSGHKLLIVAPDGWYRPSVRTGHLVCLDVAAAGVGDRVLVSFGDPARSTSPEGERTPAEAVVLAVVDGWSDERGTHGDVLGGDTAAAAAGPTAQARR
ncbi:MAG TPA: EutN/CcmL family microcompartment protein [Myxococcota bacterium]|nr:EutN/CcmL family microcompartment protein [Myxococcota bacterium]